MGRQASGVIGIRLRKNDYVVGMEVVSKDAGDILFATENGYGKKVSTADFRIAHRGGIGVRTIPTDKRNGKVIGLTIVTDTSDLLLIDKSGKIIRLPATEIRTMGRQAKGVRLIKLDSGQQLSSVVAFEHVENDFSDEDVSSGGGEKPKALAGPFLPDEGSMNFGPELFGDFEFTQDVTSPENNVVDADDDTFMVF